MRITSTQNGTVKDLRRAASTGRPTEEGLLVAEGPHLLEEALRSSWRVERIVATPAALDFHHRLIERASTEVVEVPARTFAAITSTETSQEILTVLHPHHWTWRDVLTQPPLIVVLDGIQDPGNAGTIARSAEAFGATGIVLTSGSVRVSNGKFLRAASGSIFRLPYLESVAPDQLIAKLRAESYPLYSLTANGRTDLSHADFRVGCALVVGAEGAGVSAALIEGSQTVSIRTRKVESLNAAVACSIALFQAFIQRDT